jgi:phenylpropionate dioxygenase-like ring-hydroxylating dioxygenase large terminal subunit
MTFLKNAWYPAAWNEKLAEDPLAIRILDDPIVLFRESTGKVCALYDACPHRFAPLSLGKVKDGAVVCGYHGLEFDGTGNCIRNPHGKGTIPKALGVRAYPTAERYGMIWVWAGEADLADEDLLPSFPIMDDENFSWVFGELEVSANYELVIDNLLDLTHVEFLHPLLASEGGSQRTTFRSEHDGDTVSAFYETKDEAITGLFQLLWENEEKTATIRADMHWQPPTYFELETSMGVHAEFDENDARVPVLHLLTPQSEDSTRYFWAAGRNRAHGNEEVAGMLHFGIQAAFVNEDEPMIKAVRSRMSSNDLFAHKPALLPWDEAGVRARRVLAKLIAAEQKGK